ncbi:MAG: hypothetical protein LBJ67_17020 [Planctomycetaceae bacterium]|nr:hypothetical protein [Planctomycetaceae bacterium]
MMDVVEALYSWFDNQSSFATMIRVVFQCLLPAWKIDELFNKTAQEQYKRSLWFSTLMMLTFEVVMCTGNFHSPPLPSTSGFYSRFFSVCLQ